MKRIVTFLIVAFTLHEISVPIVYGAVSLASFEAPVIENCLRESEH